MSVWLEFHEMQELKNAKGPQLLNGKLPPQWHLALPNHSGHISRDDQQPAQKGQTQIPAQHMNWGVGKMKQL